jgi:hypothetical protein
MESAPVAGFNVARNQLSVASVALGRLRGLNPHCSLAAAGPQHESAEKSALIREGQYRIYRKRKEKID